jgi:hypothetical protein
MRSIKSGKQYPTNPVDTLSHPDKVTYREMKSLSEESMNQCIISYQTNPCSQYPTQLYLYPIYSSCLQMWKLDLVCFPMMLLFHLPMCHRSCCVFQWAVVIASQSPLQRTPPCRDKQGKSTTGYKCIQLTTYSQPKAHQISGLCHI